MLCGNKRSYIFKTSKSTKSEVFLIEYFQDSIRNWQVTTTDAFTFPEEILNRNTSLFWVLAVSEKMKQVNCINKYYSPPYSFNSTIQVYLLTNLRKNFVPAKFWQIFKLSSPIIMRGQKPCQQSHKCDKRDFYSKTLTTWT